MILSVVLYGCETWSLIIKVKMYTKNIWEQVAERNIWTEGGEILGSWSKRLLRNFVTCTLRTSEGEEHVEGM
jgi:hypothetical protein